MLILISLFFCGCVVEAESLDLLKLDAFRSMAVHHLKQTVTNARIPSVVSQAAPGLNFQLTNVRIAHFDVNEDNIQLDFIPPNKLTFDATNIHTVAHLNYKLNVKIFTLTLPYSGTVTGATTDAKFHQKIDMDLDTLKFTPSSCQADVGDLNIKFHVRTVLDIVLNTMRPHILRMLRGEVNKILCQEIARFLANDDKIVKALFG